MKNLEKYLIDFDTLKVGDKVWSIEEGEVEITELFPDKKRTQYQIETQKESYTKEGKYQPQNNYPSLFKSNPFEAISEYPKVMEVSDDKDFTHSRIGVVFTIKQGKYVAWGVAETIKDSENTLDCFAWKYAREIQPEKKKTRLTMEEIAKLANIDVKDLEIVK